MALDTVLRIAHDVSLSFWFGGSAMGAVSLNAATIEVDDHTQRTRVANAGWFRWAPTAAAAIALHVASAAALGRLAPLARFDSGRSRRLAQARTVLTLLAAAVTLETGLSGRRVASAGDVPVATAVKPIAATPPEVAAAQNRLRTAQWLVPAFSGLVWILEELQRSAPPATSLGRLRGRAPTRASTRSVPWRRSPAAGARRRCRPRA